MKREFVLKKMESEPAEPVRYYLDMDGDFVRMNDLIGHTLYIKHTGYQCLSCGSDEPVYARGFCKKCFFESPLAGQWFIHPEKSTAHLDIADRDLDYEKKIQLAPHVVYLAKTSDVKVGVTRRSQVPTRWIDQGATEAMIIMETPNRYLAGLTEVALKSHLDDKTRWRQMLRPGTPGGDLEEVFQRIREHIPVETRAYLLDERPVYRFVYPVESYPESLKSVNLKKEKEVEGKLLGIKGQYLIFADGKVLNIRNHEGFRVEFSV